MSLEDTKDGLEVINRLLIVIPILTILLGGPAWLFAVHHNLPVFRIFNSDSLVLNMLLALFITSFCALDWVIMITLALTSFLHANSNIKWVVRSRRAW